MSGSFKFGQKNQPNASVGEQDHNAEKLTKTDVRNIVFYYGLSAVVLGNLLYDWIKSFR